MPMLKRFASEGFIAPVWRQVYESERFSCGCEQGAKQGVHCRWHRSNHLPMANFSYPCAAGTNMSFPKNFNLEHKQIYAGYIGQFKR